MAGTTLDRDTDISKAELINDCATSFTEVLSIAKELGTSIASLSKFKAQSGDNGPISWRLEQLGPRMESLYEKNSKLPDDSAFPFFSDLLMTTLAKRQHQGSETSWRECVDNELLTNLFEEEIRLAADCYREIATIAGSRKKHMNQIGTEMWDALEEKGHNFDDSVGLVSKYWSRQPMDRDGPMVSDVISAIAAHESKVRKYDNDPSLIRTIVQAQSRMIHHLVNADTCRRYMSDAPACNPPDYTLPSWGKRGSSICQKLQDADNLLATIKTENIKKRIDSLLETQQKVESQMSTASKSKQLSLEEEAFGAWWKRRQLEKKLTENESVGRASSS